MVKTLEYEGGQMTYEVDGEGSQPVIVMHGWGCNKSTVASITRVAAESCRVYTVDFPGFGDSPEPPSVWGVEEYTRIIERLIEAEHLEKPVLVGHSFGGRVAIVLASRNEVGKVILVDAAGVKPRRSLTYYLKVYSFKAGRIMWRLLLGEKKAAARIEKSRARRASADYLNASPKMRAILSKVVNEDLKHLMPKISAPTLLVWGSNDTATPLADAKVMEQLIPDAGLVEFKNCGHYSFLDNPVQFAAVLRNFLNS